jgi:hypothetical protein
MTFFTIVSFLFSDKPFIFVLEPFPSCFLYNLITSIICASFRSFNLSSSIFPIDFKHTYIVSIKRQSPDKNKLFFPLHTLSFSWSFHINY